jgi:hypothetical protein
MELEVLIDLRKFEWMRNLHGAVQDMQLKLIHGLLDLASSLSQSDGFNTKLVDFDTSRFCNLIYYT